MQDHDHAPLARPHRPVAAIPAQVAACALAGLAAMQALRLAGLSGTAAAWHGAFAIHLLCCGAIGARMLRHYPHDRIGGANAVTFLRAAITCALLPPLLGGQAAGWTVAGAAAIALALDGVDGWLARRSGLTSAFGARFDMEVDAALALILALHAWQGTDLGPQVLLLGLVRYGFVAACAVLPWLGAALPPRFRRKLVCVLQLSALIVLQTPLLAPPQAAALAWIAAAVVIWSFAIDIRWLVRRRR